MSDLSSLATLNFPLFSVASSSSDVGGDLPAQPNGAMVGYTAASDGGGVTGVFDSLTGAATNIFHSFTQGISSVISGTAKNYTNYLNGTGQVVGYDRYNNPIYLVTDPVTGAQTTSATPAWPGGTSNPSNSPERIPNNYQTGGVWGWLTNSLSLPAVLPQKSLGTVTPAQPQQSFLTAPILGGFNVEQVALGLLAAYAVYYVTKKVF